MDGKIYKITLSDGTTIENLRLNGNNFVSNGSVEKSIFDGNCSPITINDGETDTIHENMELINVRHESDGYWIVLRDIPKDKLEKIKMQSDIAYLAMMTNVEL